jgi:hypothetical protein
MQLASEAAWLMILNSTAFSIPLIFEGSGIVSRVPHPEQSEGWETTKASGAT